MLYQTKNPHGGDIYGQQILLDYSANTNPYGTPQAVKDAIAHALDDIHHYPDPYCRELVQAIAGHENTHPEWILCGNGAAELIYAFCEAVKPSCALELAPTFSEYSLGLKRFGTRLVRYELKEEADFTPDAGLPACLEAQKPEAVFICNPNNPTGQLMDGRLLRAVLDWCRDHRARLFLDECFMDLCEGGQSMKELLGAYPEMIILKAFTKSYGMAGVRLGYCMCADSALLRRMSETVQPWNVSTLAQRAGIAALGESAFMEKTRTTVFAERKWLSRALEALGFRVCPGHANYILFRGPIGLDAALRSRGIAIRSCENYAGLDAGWYRIAVRLREQNEMLIAAIRQVCGRE